MHDRTTEFESERDRLMAVAYRMLGSRAEAEDAVQETWLRYATALERPEARAEIRDLRAWLTTATARICLDVLRSARVRREAYPGQWLPEPVVTRLGDVPAAARSALNSGPTGFAPDPAERVAHTDEVGIALLVVLERLSPEQRVAFVLHDAFAVPFERIATVLGTTSAAARQLASRARRAVAEGTPRHTPDLAEQRRVLRAFLAAAESGDLDRLVAVLAPDAVFVGDGGGLFPAAPRPVTGAVKAARFIRNLFQRAALDTTALQAEAVLVNGSLGLLMNAIYHDGRPLRSVMSFTVSDGRITAVFNQLNPEKVARVPAVGPGAGAWPPRL